MRTGSDGDRSANNRNELERPGRLPQSADSLPLATGWSTRAANGSVTRYFGQWAEPDAAHLRSLMRSACGAGLSGGDRTTRLGQSPAAIGRGRACWMASEPCSTPSPRERRRADPSDQPAEVQVPLPPSTPQQAVAVSLPRGRAPSGTQSGAARTTSS